MESEERLPFQVTTGAAAYDEIRQLPVTLLLENLRSLHNVGAFFRTADAARVESLLLCGITGCPPRKEITKTALGADETVRWEYAASGVEAAQRLRGLGYEFAVVETSVHSVDLFDWRPNFPVCIAFGSEVDGISPQLMEAADTHVRLPMLGIKHSLNVATAGGIVAYELLRKYRELLRQSRT